MFKFAAINKYKQQNKLIYYYITNTVNSNWHNLKLTDSD